MYDLYAVSDNYGGSGFGFSTHTILSHSFQIVRDYPHTCQQDAVHDLYAESDHFGGGGFGHYKCIVF